MHGPVNMKLVGSPLTDKDKSHSKGKRVYDCDPRSSLHPLSSNVAVTIRITFLASCKLATSREYCSFYAHNITPAAVQNHLGHAILTLKSTIVIVSLQKVLSDSWWTYSQSAS